jgi:ABC-type multidrug transport system ATPase subunit
MDNGSTSQNGNVIVINDLVKHFGDVKAVNGLNLEIPKGEMFGFLGPNGAGKTTAINMLCGLLEPTAGTAYVAGYDVTKDTNKMQAHIGVCPQEAAMLPNAGRKGTAVA